MTTTVDFKKISDDSNCIYKVDEDIHINTMIEILKKKLNISKTIRLVFNNIVLIPYKKLSDYTKEEYVILYIIIQENHYVGVYNSSSKVLSVFNIIDSTQLYFDIDIDYFKITDESIICYKRNINSIIFWEIDI